MLKGTFPSSPERLKRKGKSLAHLCAMREFYCYPPTLVCPAVVENWWGLEGGGEGGPYSL